MITTINTINIEIINTILNDLNIKYRCFEMKNKELFICTFNDLTFDILVENNSENEESIKLWRFVGSTSESKAGARIECRSSEKPNTTVGFEVTDEGDISMFETIIIDKNNVSIRKDITAAIKSFCRIITCFHYEKISM